MSFYGSMLKKLNTVSLQILLSELLACLFDLDIAFQQKQIVSKFHEVFENDRSWQTSCSCIHDTYQVDKG